MSLNQVSILNTTRLLYYLFREDCFQNHTRKTKLPVTQRARGFAHFTFTVKAARGCLTLPQFPRTLASEPVRPSPLLG
jgi:hypothetical protein